MANVTWKPDTDGDWSVAADWSTGVLPTQVDSVTINTPHARTIRHSTGNDKVAQLNVLDDAIALSGGTLAATSTASFGGQLSITGGVLGLGGNANVAGPYAQTNGTVTVEQHGKLTP